MTTITKDPDTTPQPLWQRLLFRIPVVGWIARDLFRDDSSVWWAVGLWISFWGCCILLFGLPGLIVPALFMTFVMFIFLIVISLG